MTTGGQQLLDPSRGCCLSPEKCAHLFCFNARAAVAALPPTMVNVLRLDLNRVEKMNGTPVVRMRVSATQIFLAFLAVGATSFGGSVVPHLRRALVGRRWIDDQTFAELLAISQVLPGLNAANLAVLVGDRLRPTLGAIAAIGGLCMPGTIFMYGAGVAYRLNGQRPMVAAALAGVAAAALGLTLATTSQLGRKSFTSLSDLGLIALTLIGVSVLHIFEPLVLFGVGMLAIGWYGTRKAPAVGPRM